MPAVRSRGSRNEDPRWRPHVLGIDDGPFVKRRRPHPSRAPGSSPADETPVVAVRTEGRDLVEGIAVSRFPIDGADATGFLAEWIRGLRFHQGLQGIVLGGIVMVIVMVTVMVTLIGLVPVDLDCPAFPAPGTPHVPTLLA